MDTYEYKNVGAHAEDLEGGRVVGVGEMVELTKEQLRDPHNERLVAEGILIPTTNEAEHEATLADRRTQRQKDKDKDIDAAVVAAETGGADS